MASISANHDSLTSQRDRHGPSSLPSVSRADPVEPPLFRFHLRQLLVFVAVISIILATMVLLQGVAALALLLAVLVVAAHLFSTALASRLRSRTDDEQALARAMDRRVRPASQITPYSNSPQVPSCRRSPWHARGSTSLPWLPRLIVAGVVVGGMLGASVLGATIGHRTTLAGVAVGGISSAVLGGWFAFLGGSFYGIFRHGLRDAIAEQKKDEGRLSKRS